MEDAQLNLSIQVRHFNNLIEQNYRKVKGKMHQFLEWKLDKGTTAITCWHRAVIDD
ncbi:hypothetical protein BTN49_0625 [Candidatus Enterovibrio escicola]|uniref:Uncharacterized protein n=1 Tax=Candidatus Enterovibrio escicola TaxID=1927127 RepID=A0A2A5T688_9GAMM|nr:hypothetical protein BTN49_0625 [Candidatus Enterovibrio escacola]